MRNSPAGQVCPGDCIVWAGGNLCLVVSNVPGFLDVEDAPHESPVWNPRRITVMSTSTGMLDVLTYYSEETLVRLL